MRRRTVAAWGAAIVVPASSLAFLPAAASGFATAPVAGVAAEGHATIRVPATSDTAVPDTAVPDTAAARPEASGSADVRHVDCRAGSDDADGSAAAPWRTPQAVAKHSLPDGAQVLLRRGCAWEGAVRLAGERITLGAFGDGAAPVLTDERGDRLTPVLTLASPGGTVRDLAVVGGAGAGVQVAAAGATVTRTEVTGTAFGVQFVAPDGVADAVYVHDLHMDINTPGGDDDSGAVCFDVRAPRATVRGSHAERCRAPSYDYGHDGGFVEVWKSGDGLQVLDNTAIEVNGFLEAGGQGGSDSFHGAQIRGNAVVRSHGGIGVHDEGHYAIDASSIVLRDNDIQVVDGELTYGDAGALSIDASNRIGPGAPGTLRPNPAGPPTEDAAASSASSSAAASTAGTPSSPSPAPAAREWVYDDGVGAWGLWEWRGQGWVLVEVSEAGRSARPDRFGRTEAPSG